MTTMKNIILALATMLLGAACLGGCGKSEQVPEKLQPKLTLRYYGNIGDKQILFSPFDYDLKESMESGRDYAQNMNATQYFWYNLLNGNGPKCDAPSCILREEDQKGAIIFYLDKFGDETVDGVVIRQENNDITKCDSSMQDEHSKAVIAEAQKRYTSLLDQIKQKSIDALQN